MRLLQGIIVASFLALIWLGVFALWGMIHLSNGSLELHASIEPVWFQSFNLWFSAFVWFLLAGSITSRTYRIVRVANGKADAAERKATLYGVWKRGRLMRVLEGFIIPIAGTLGVIAALAIAVYAVHLRTGMSGEQIIALTKPVVMPIVALSVLVFAGGSIWLFWQESGLLRSSNTPTQPWFYTKRRSTARSLRR